MEMRDLSQLRILFTIELTQHWAAKSATIVILTQVPVTGDESVFVAIAIPVVLKMRWVKMEAWVTALRAKANSWLNRPIKNVEFIDFTISDDKKICTAGVATSSQPSYLYYKGKLWKYYYTSSF